MITSIKIIVPTLNTYLILPKLINSLKVQTWKDWNLLFIDVGKIKDIFIKKRVEKKFFEYGSPQWISGITFFAGSIKNLFCLAKKYNTWIIEQYQDLKYIQKFDLPFSSVNDFSAFDQKVVLTGSGYDF